MLGPSGTSLEDDVTYGSETEALGGPIFPEIPVWTSESLLWDMDAPGKLSHALESKVEQKGRLNALVSPCNNLYILGF